MKTFDIIGICLKLTLPGVFLLMLACEKEDSAAAKLHGDSGVWLMESWSKTEYDTLGNEVNKQVVEDGGEFVFFSSLGLAALSRYRVGLFVEYSDPVDTAFTLTYMCDGTILSIDDYGGPFELKNVFTVIKGNGRRQEWEYVELHPSATSPFSIRYRILISLKEISR